MDILNPSNQIVKSAFINEICQKNPNYHIWPEFEQEEYKRKIKEYYLDKEFIAYTFTENQLKGTPSFILFNESYEIIDQWFGHKKLEDIEQLLDEWINK